MVRDALAVTIFFSYVRCRQRKDVQSSSRRRWVEFG